LADDHTDTDTLENVKSDADDESETVTISDTESNHPDDLMWDYFDTTPQLKPATDTKLPRGLKNRDYKPTCTGLKQGVLERMVKILLKTY